MNERNIEKTAKEIEKHLEELIKVKMMRILSESLHSPKVSAKWQPILSLIESIQPGSLKKLRDLLKENLNSKIT